MPLLETFRRNSSPVVGPKVSVPSWHQPTTEPALGSYEFNSHPNAPRCTEMNQNTRTLHILVLCPRIKRDRHDFSHFCSDIRIQMNATSTVRSALSLDTLYDYRKMTMCWRKVGVDLQTYRVPDISENVCRESLKSYRAHHQHLFYP